MLDVEAICQLLDYDPTTGEFIWLAREETSHFQVGWNKKFAGKAAGRKKVTVYREIAIDSRLYYAHRLAWLYMTGEWPQEQIDHIDGDKLNNRFENLREATVPENAWNVHYQKPNQYGFEGVSFHANCRSRPYSSRIQIAGKNKYLGYFATPEEAHQAYVEAAKLHHGEFARFD